MKNSGKEGKRTYLGLVDVDIKYRVTTTKSFQCEADYLWDF